MMLDLEERAPGYWRRGHLWRATAGRRPVHLAACPCWRTPVVAPAPARFWHRWLLT